MTDTTQTPEQDAMQQDTPDTPRIDPRELARSVAIAVAEEPEQVGDVVEEHELGDGVTDFRVAAHVKGYEGWQWSVTLYHDEELDRWTVNESSLIPTDDALMPPPWIPWKDRLEPTDLAPTDSIGTDPDDPRLEDGFRRTEPVADADGGTADADGGVADEAVSGDAGDDADASDDARQAAGPSDDVASDDSREDVDEAVEEFDLSRRHVLSPLGRAQTAKRWYDGPRGPKAMSTKTASGHLCSTCGFFVPLKGELNLLFGVCANKWSPDDGRVVSLDHGCGEHSEIDPPEPSRLWVQSKPAFDDLHIDIIAQKPREERAQVEILEQEEDDAAAGHPETAEPAGPIDATDESPADAIAADDETAEATEQDIEENTEIDADAPEIEENTVEADVPELEAVVELDADGDDAGEDDADDSEDAEDAEDDGDGRNETDADESATDDSDAVDGTVETETSGESATEEPIEPDDASDGDSPEEDADAAGDDTENGAGDDAQ